MGEREQAEAWLSNRPSKERVASLKKGSSRHPRTRYGDLYFYAVARHKGHVVNQLIDDIGSISPIAKDMSEPERRRLKVGAYRQSYN